MNTKKNIYTESRFKLIKVVILVFVMSGMQAHTFAKDVPALKNKVYVNLIDQVDRLFDNSSDCTGIGQLKAISRKNNPTVRIAKRRIRQVKHEANSIRAQILPMNTGLMIGYALGNSWNVFAPLQVADLVLNLPSKWNSHKSKRSSAKAERYQYLSVLADLNNSMSDAYYKLLSQDIVLKTFEWELLLLDAWVEAIESKKQYGLADEDDYNQIVRRRYAILSELPNAKIAWARDVQLFNNLVGLEGRGTLIYDFEHKSQKIKAKDINSDLEYLVENSRKKSYEIKRLKYLEKAMTYEIKAQKWDVFNLINRSKKSKISKAEKRNIRRQRKKFYGELENQVLFAHSNLIDSIALARESFQIADFSRRQVEGGMELLVAGKLEVEELVEFELLYLQDFRRAVQDHYRTYIKISDLERLVRDKVTK